MNDIQLRKFTIGNAQPLTLMGGMNVLESRDLAFRVAEEFKSASDKLRQACKALKRTCLCRTPVRPSQGIGHHSDRPGNRKPFRPSQ